MCFFLFIAPQENLFFKEVKTIRNDQLRAVLVALVLRDAAVLDNTALDCFVGPFSIAWGLHLNLNYECQKCANRQVYKADVKKDKGEMQDFGLFDGLKEENGSRLIFQDIERRRWRYHWNSALPVRLALPSREEYFSIEIRWFSTSLHLLPITISTDNSQIALQNSLELRQRVLSSFAVAAGPKYSSRSASLCCRFSLSMAILASRSSQS